MSKDFRVYTFHIRPSAKWSDGTPVTAQDFAWSYRRLLTPSTSTTDRLDGASSYQSGLGIRNAVGFQLGRVKAWSQVGVKALDSSRLRIVPRRTQRELPAGDGLPVDGAAAAQERDASTSIASRSRRNR